jgi:hypothetical protein
MLKFIYNFIRAWRIATQELEYADVYDAPEVWQVEDVNRLRAFINSPSGQKLMKRMVNMVYKAAITATQWPNDAKYHVGIARGVAMTVDSFQQHFLHVPTVPVEPTRAGKRI